MGKARELIQFNPAHETRRVLCYFLPDCALGTLADWHRRLLFEGVGGSAGGCAPVTSRTLHNSSEAFFSVIAPTWKPTEKCGEIMPETLQRIRRLSVHSVGMPILMISETGFAARSLDVVIASKLTMRPKYCFIGSCPYPENKALEPVSGRAVPVNLLAMVRETGILCGDIIFWTSGLISSGSEVATVLPLGTGCHICIHGCVWAVKL